MLSYFLTQNGGVFMFDCIITIAGITVQVFTHACPHADELATLFLLENVGTKEFVEKYCADGILYLGIDGGPFDEHVKGRKGKSCLLLVAEALGIDLQQEPWCRIVDFVNMNDVSGRKSDRDIAALLKQMMMQNPTAQDDHAQWFMNGLLVKYYDGMNRDFTIDRISEFATQLREIDFDINDWKRKGEEAHANRQIFYQNALEELAAKCRNKKLRQTTVKKGKKFLKVFLVESGNYMMSAALRSKYDADVVFIKNDHGNILISVRQKEVNGIEEVAAVLRYKEQFCKGKMLERDWKMLREDYTLPTVPEWCLISDMKMVTNGGITHPCTPKTMLSYEEIIDAIKIGLGEDFWQNCEGGCSNCGWKKYGLKRCRSKRFAATQKNNFSLF